MMNWTFTNMVIVYVKSNPYFNVHLENPLYFLQNTNKLIKAQIYFHSQPINNCKQWRVHFFRIDNYLLNIFLDIFLDKVSFPPSLSLEVSLLNLFFICRKLTIFTSISFSFSDRITFCWTASINWELTLKYLDMTGTYFIFFN